MGDPLEEFHLVKPKEQQGTIVLSCLGDVAEVFPAPLRTRTTHKERREGVSRTHRAAQQDYDAEQAPWLPARFRGSARGWEQQLPATVPGETRNTG